MNLVDPYGPLRSGDLFRDPYDDKVYEYVGEGTGDSGEPQDTVRLHEGPTSGPPAWVTTLVFALATFAVGLAIFFR